MEIDPKVVGGLVCLLLVGAGIKAKQSSKASGNLPLPPSPPATHWWWGHEVPAQYGWLKVEEWINEYGPVISIRQGRETVVIVGRHQAAIDIMEKQGGSTLDRPSTVAAGDILSGGYRFAFTPGGERFRRMRRAVHTHLQPKAAEKYELMQMDHAKDTILDLINDPSKYGLHATRYASSVIQKVTYGKTSPTSADDPEVQQVRLSLDRLRYAMRPGRYLVDTLTFLKYIPWYGRELKKWNAEDRQLYTGQLNKVKNQLDNNEDTGPSFGKYLLENKTETGLTEMEMAYLAGGFFAAGSDTTAVAICIMIVSAATHPEAQAKVQAELDSVVGLQRAPTFADIDNVPRLQAFILESFRWRPVASTGLPHRANKDIIWGNYFIPAGTTVVGNHWAISRDPDVYPNPDSFQPERWLDSQGKIKDNIKFPTYGFGRRVCAGQHVANRSVYINTVLILWAFRLSLCDPSEAVDDMAFAAGAIPSVIPKISFAKRMDEDKLRYMMETYAEGL
ncbi:hypothetical protein SERLA73DRAFT_179744 [Serpula lacrymans var. lacrymans S7.3]|uniref:Cytochrome P450 n=2 Tax=Serpula lacrymans var. lacrymans TaxID=341189 RepID=F8PU08_SERL3|nr:uncharacterized protein SERLADRAFT_464997 [Serpula lacrymans var. lacrymans S7.9]EGN99633.1 hypothetical protein SERLA73DRAFT_179744 [Serpula lacrymans var. lacrymans S7.3]EGO25198.1 hypothetical protein SERLADRAFT_464997 [Serpula lacrymans var. lacrymans S7.9]